MKLTGLILGCLIALPLLLISCAPAVVEKEAVEEEVVEEESVEGKVAEEETAEDIPSSMPGEHSSVAPTQEPSTPSTNNDVELKYDDGLSNGSCSVGRSYGYLIRFSPPDDALFAIDKVKMLTNLKGSNHEDQIVWYEVWDQNLNTIYYQFVSAASFSYKPTWMTLDIPDFTVDGDFYIFFYPCSTREGGVYLHYDSSQTNHHSEMVEPGLHAHRGWWEQMPKEETNWMIRVIGGSTHNVIDAPSVTFKVIEGTAEFQKTINSLDNPVKLSQWMIDNIEGESYYEKEKETGIRYTLSPNETFEIKRGNCRVFAVFACYVFQYHAYEAEILSIKVESDERYNHAVCVYHYDDLLYINNSGRIEGPYQNYEDIASSHHEDWSRYEVTYSWDKFQKGGPPDKVVEGQQ